MTGSLGSWIGCLVVGLLVYLLAPFAPPPLDRLLRVVGIVLLVFGAVLFLLWLLGLLGVLGGAYAAVVLV